MSNKWVVNASPFILLAKASQIEALPKLTEQLVVPSGVADEIGEGPENDPARQWLKGNGARFIVPDVETVPGISAWDLGKGETAVLAWAFLNHGFEAIIDDRAARKCANVEGLRFRGTIGVILAARKHGLVPKVKPVFDNLVHAGLLIDKAILHEALRLAGE